jgi:hypothetical protein
MSENDNAHIGSLLVAAFVDNRVTRRPPVRLGSTLATTDDSWLLNLTAKAQGYSRAKFGGPLAAEFQHLTDKKVRLIDFNAHMQSVKKSKVRAISRTRYGYDDDDDYEGPGWGDSDHDDETDF